jgi:hypothetical protein
MIIAPTQAIDPSDLWRQREVGRSTDIVVDGERGREDFVGNGSSFTEVRPGTRLQQPLRMRAISPLTKSRQSGCSCRRDPLEVENYTRENTKEKIVTDLGIHGGKVTACSGYNRGASSKAFRRRRLL